MNNVKVGQGRGRKPVSMGKGSSQDVIWAAIRELGGKGNTFTFADLTWHIHQKGHTKINSGTVKSYLHRLKKAKFIATTEPVRIAVKSHFILLKNTGAKTPRLTKDGRPVTQGRGREQLWRTIRVLGEFNYRELTAAATTEEVIIKETEAKDYIKNLKKAGYIKEIIPANKHGGLARYRLIPARYTGPKPPMIQRIKQIFDPNLGEVVWSPLSEEACKWK
jgi:hypothetical protein